MSATEIINAAKALSLDERVELVQRLWDDIADDGYDPSLTPAQAAELERRVAEHHANPGDVVSWEQVKADSEVRHPRRS
jgi:putative addiction module component (TIGR02574 family)